MAKSRFTRREQQTINDAAARVNRAVANAEYSVKGSSSTSPMVRGAVERYRATVSVLTRRANAREAYPDEYTPRPPEGVPNRDRPVTYDEREGVYYSGRRTDAQGRSLALEHHEHRHAEPSHHVGMCDVACRSGKVAHGHRPLRRGGR